MRYQGSKTRLAKRIAAEIRQRKGTRRFYVEPFLGAGAVMAELKGDFSERVGFDVNESMILLWQALGEGWQPPTEVSRETYQELKTAPPSALKAFVGTVCSFGGKWFGGYASDPNPDRNFAAEGCRSVLRRFTGLEGSLFQHADYREAAPIGSDTVVYCDPPYRGATTYAGTPRFDHDEFYSVAEEWVKRGALVIVSEYTAPDHWNELATYSRHSSTALDNRGARATDRLFEVQCG